MTTKSKVHKKQRPPTVTVFFPDDSEKLQRQIVSDADTIGISASALVRMAIEIGYPEVRKHFSNLRFLPEVEDTPAK